MTSFPLEKLKPFYGFIDPAGPKRRAEGLKNVASRSAIVVAGSDDLGRVFVLHAWAARCSTEKFLDTLASIHERFRPKLIGCEEVAFSGLLTDVLRLFSHRHLPLVGVKQPSNQEKDFRIRTTLQPLVANGRLFLLGNDSGMLELKAEITTFPMNFRKDLIDTLASVCRLMPLRAKRAGVDDERAAYLRYLRESGAPPDVIEREARASRPSPVASALPRGAA